MGGSGRRGGPGRPRQLEIDRLILEAAGELLRAHGPGAVNIDAVAARSGVARSSIYRRYRSRDELLSGLLDGLMEAELPAPTVPVADKLLWVLERVLAVLEDGIGPGGIAAVLTSSEAGFTDALRQRLTDRFEALRQAMAADIEAGRLSARVDPDTLVGLLFGAYLAEVLRYGEPRAGWAERTVDFLTPAVAAH